MEQKVEGKITSIGLAEYNSVLPSARHVFLVGDLRQPSPHPFIRDPRVEFIVCNYQSGDNGFYHWHRHVTEYEWVVEGEVGYFDVASGAERWFTRGDFFTIPSSVCVRRLIRKLARTVALKVPSLSEKVSCGQCMRICRWRTVDYEGDEGGITK